MKKIMKGLWIGSLAVGLLAGSAFVVRAEDDKPMMGDEEGAPGRIEKMKEKLGLTDDQVLKLKSIRESQKTEMAPLWKKQLADLKTLGDKVKASAKDEELNPLLDSLNQGRQTIESVRTRYMEQMRNILTPTQQAKMVLSMTKMRMDWMKNMGQKWKEKQEQNSNDSSEK